MKEILTINSQKGYNISNNFRIFKKYENLDNITDNKEKNDQEKYNKLSNDKFSKKIL